MTPNCERIAALASLVAVFLTAALELKLEPVARGGDETSIQTIMEQINTKNRAIGKGLRNSFATEAPGRKTLAADAASLIQLGKEARTLTGPARERKKSQEEWIQTVDEFLRDSQELAKVIADPGSSRSRATQSYQKLQKSCTHCHSAFRGEAD